MRAIPDNNLDYPVLIKTTKGSGSGFFLNWEDKKIFLVTALHVLFKKDEQGNSSLISNNVELLFYRDGIVQTIQILDLRELTIIKNDTDDIVLVQISDTKKVDGEKHEGVFLKGVVSTGGRPRILTLKREFIKKFNEILISNTVYVLGYPNSLSVKIGSESPEIDADSPLLRVGIVAGKNLKKKTIILDCPVYFGNSGGIALEVEETPGEKKFRAIGVVSKYVPFIDQLKSQRLGYVNTTSENSGYSVVVPFDSIIALIEESAVLEGVATVR